LLAISGIIFKPPLGLSKKSIMADVEAPAVEAPAAEAPAEAPAESGEAAAANSLSIQLAAVNFADAPPVEVPEEEAEAAAAPVAEASITIVEAA